MRILLTNDDGIRAPGLAAMHGALADPSGALGGPLLDPSPGAVTRSPRSVVLPIAPLTAQSASSHGITYREPLMVEEAEVAPGIMGTAIDGRPADCVKLAISAIWPERFGAGSRPDLVVSGVNAGANCGINVIYSGTVAAALEAAFLGVPSIAVSLHIGAGRPRFDVAAAHARRTIERLIARGLPRPHECLNINIPVTESETPMPEVRICRMNTHGMIDAYEKRTSPAGTTYYWAAGNGFAFHATDEGSDVFELFRGRITVTPLAYDLTRHDALGTWTARTEDAARRSSR